MALEHGAGAALTHVALKSLIYGCISIRAGYLLSSCSNLVDHQGIEPCPPLRPLWVFVQQEPSWPKMEDRENFEISTRGLKARRSASELPVHDRHGIGGPCEDRTHRSRIKSPAGTPVRYGPISVRRQEVSSYLLSPMGLASTH